MKNKLTYHIFILSLFIFIGFNLSAQSVSLRVANQVIQGQRFTVSISVVNGDAAITRDSAPKLNGCTLFAGPAVSTMQSVQVTNGHYTSSVTKEYTFTYSADKAGSVVIPAIKVQVDGKEMSTQSKTITILPPDRNSGSRPNSGGFPDEFDEFEEWVNQMMGIPSSRPNAPAPSASAPSSNSDISPNDFLVTVTMSKSDIYEKEAVIATIKLYTKHDVTKFQPVVMPQFEGFLSEELDVSNQQPQIEHVRGDNYYSVVLKRCLLYPQKAGKLTINSGTYDVTLETVEYVSNGYYATPVKKSRNITTRSNSISVNVKPLPTPIPASFNGAVGTFDVTASLNSERLRTNEAARYILKITGTGNLKHLAEPIVPLPANVEEYTPTGESDARFNGSNMQGTYTATYTFVPQEVGKLIIPSWDFTYFNPATAKYITVSLPAFERDVVKGIAGATTSNQNLTEESEALRDILYITHVDESELTMNHKRIFYSGWYWLLYILALAVLISALVIYRKNINAKADVQALRIKKARSVAAKRLQKAKSAMNAHDSENFYAALSAALVGFLSDKLKLPASALTRENIKEALGNAGAPTDMVDRTIGLLDECEMARFTPVHSDTEMSTVYSEASSLIDSLNRVNTRVSKTQPVVVKSKYEA